MQIQLAFVARDLKKACALIVAEIVASDGNQTAASKRIEIDDRQLRRWITRLHDNGFDVREAARAAGVTVREHGRRHEPKVEKKKPAKRRSAA